jgi:hypothetical protein
LAKLERAQRGGAAGPTVNSGDVDVGTGDGELSVFSGNCAHITKKKYTAEECFSFGRTVRQLRSIRLKETRLPSFEESFRALFERTSEHDERLASIN